MLTKAEALAKTTAEDDADEKRLEALIDERLSAFQGGSVVVVDVGGTSGKARDRVWAKYSGAGGWKISSHDGDYRDPGPFWTFS